MNLQRSYEGTVSHKIEEVQFPSAVRQQSTRLYQTAVNNTSNEVSLCCTLSMRAESRDQHLRQVHNHQSYLTFQVKHLSLLLYSVYGDTVGTHYECAAVIHLTSTCCSPPHFTL